MTSKEETQPSSLISLTRDQHRWLMVGAALCLLSVMIGAFAAHGLKATLSEYQLGIVQTGARYQMYHGIAVLIVTIVCAVLSVSRWATNIVNGAFLLGSVLFSGSLYLLALSAYRGFAIVTPVGGFCFLFGWGVFIWLVLRASAQNKEQSH